MKCLSVANFRVKDFAKYDAADEIEFNPHKTLTKAEYQALIVPKMRIYRNRDEESYDMISHFKSTIYNKDHWLACQKRAEVNLIDLGNGAW